MTKVAQILSYLEPKQGGQGAGLQLKTNIPGSAVTDLGGISGKFYNVWYDTHTGKPKKLAGETRVTEGQGSQPSGGITTSQINTAAVLLAAHSYADVIRNIDPEKREPWQVLESLRSQTGGQLDWEVILSYLRPKAMRDQFVVDLLKSVPESTVVRNTVLRQNMAPILDKEEEARMYPPETIVEYKGKLMIITEDFRLEDF